MGGDQLQGLVYLYSADLGGGGGEGWSVDKVETDPRGNGDVHQFAYASAKHNPSFQCLLRDV